MVDCNKRQREKIKGEIHHRCIHPEAETKGEIVPLEVCRACPLINLVSRTPCAEKRKEDMINGVIRASGQTPVPPPTQTVKTLPVLDNPEFPMCPYRYKGQEGHVCSITNLGVDSEICHRCDAKTRVEEKKNQAKLGTKVMNYFGAVRRWVASGSPTRTPEEVKELFETHCKGCEMYDEEKHACKTCGCNIAPVGDPLANKLAMATEHCPLGRF